MFKELGYITSGLQGVLANMMKCITFYWVYWNIGTWTIDLWSIKAYNKAVHFRRIWNKL